MARKKSTKNKRPIESYEHRDKERVNNPPVGLVTPETDPDAGQKKKRYAYDPHLDPQLVWASKAEHTSFEVPTVSLHVHERIEPRTIIEAVRKRNGNGQMQQSLFEHERREPLREAIEFYQHKHGWTNRLIAGDSLLVMNSLLEKEGMAGKVQMIYIDPPYGIKYASNFQPFVNKRDVKDGKDEDLTAEPEQIKAFRDTWELGIHSYLTYLRDRLLLARELLTESGSIFVQINDENVHHVRELMDEVFGVGNCSGLIAFRTTAPLGGSGLAASCDYLVWYAKDKQHVKFRPLFVPKPLGEGTNYMWLEQKSGKKRRLTREESQKPESLDGQLFYPSDLASSGYTETCTFDFTFNGITIKAGKKSWRTTREGVHRLIAAGRIMTLGENNRPCFIQFHADNPLQPLSNIWVDTRSAMDKKYVVETDPSVVQRCLLMTTDPGDLVFDPTCGSGTTAYVAEEWGRRWITCDTSRVALTLAKQRLMTAVFDYYELAHPEEGVGSGFKYKTVPHVTLKSIANNPDIKEGMTREQIDAAIARHAPQETLYDQPFVDRKKVRVTGPFTVEAVPAPAVKSVDELLPSPPGRGAGGEGRKPLDSELLKFARQLRREATDAERLLWSLLRDQRFLGFKFRRQHPVEPYVLDFYCHEARIAIELDGGQHNELDERARDAQRTAFLEEKGIRVLRFWNNEVLQNTEGVLQAIYDALVSLTPASPKGRGSLRPMPRSPVPARRCARPNGGMNC